MSTTEDQVLEVTQEPVEDEAAVQRAAEQKRMDNEFAAAARERAKIQETAARLLQAAERAEAAAKPPPAEDKPPVRDDFDAYEQFLEAKLEYQKKEFQGYVDRQVDSAVRLHKQSAEDSSIASRMKESAQRGEELYPGFSDAIEKVPALPQAALVAWQELPEPEHVAHYLGTHPDEAKKIGRLTPGRAAHAVISLGERLDQERAIKSGEKEKEKPDEFGPPAGGNKTAPGAPSEKMSMSQYEKARIQEKIRGMNG